MSHYILYSFFMSRNIIFLLVYFQSLGNVETIFSLQAAPTQAVGCSLLTPGVEGA